MYRGERFNSVTHLIGTALALPGFALLVTVAARQGDPWKILSFSVYGASLFLLYATSTLYHSLRGKAKARFRQFDHLAIYLLIAGTYTPFTLVTLRASSGWAIFAAIWSLAAIGIALELHPKIRARRLSVFLYALMGWLILVAFRPLLQGLGPTGLSWLLVGGLCYTAGIAFYALSGKVRHFHGFWHLFVLAGSGCHYCAVLLYVA